MSGILPPDPVARLRSSCEADFRALCFHNNERLFAGTKQGTVQLWDPQSNRSRYTLSVGKKPIINVAHTEDTLLTQEKEDGLKLWQLSNSAYVLGKEFRNEFRGWCRFLYLDNTTPVVIIPHKSNQLSILCGCTFAERQKLCLPEEGPLGTVGTVTDLKLFERGGGRYLLSVFETGTIVLWDMNTLRHISYLQLATEELLTSVDYDPESNRGVVAGFSNVINTFSLNPQSQEIRLGEPITLKNAGVNRLKIRSDKKVFASAGNDGRCRVFSWKSMRQLVVLSGHSDPLMDVIFSEDTVHGLKKKIMAVAGMDGQISLWDVYNN